MTHSESSPRYILLNPTVLPCETCGRPKGICGHLSPSEVAALAEWQAEWDRQDSAEREAVHAMPEGARPHYELNDGTCVACGDEWICAGYSERLRARSFVFFACTYACASEHGATTGGQRYNGAPVLTPRAIKAGKGRGMRADEWATLCGSEPDTDSLRELELICRRSGGEA